MNHYRHLILTLLLTLVQAVTAQTPTSVAGLIPTADCGRMVWNMNAEWRFHLGDIAHAEQPSLDDSCWDVVSTPHSVKLEPAEASGNRNYQGIAWYRKHFTLPAETRGKDVTLYFEGAMGKQRIYVDGRLVKEHLGGYLPFSVCLSDYGIRAGQTCLVAVMTDNRDDKTYPPGKTQYTLDFAYHGGIYRDVWLIACDKVAITDAVQEQRVAGGGIFVHYDRISERQAEVIVNTHIRNRHDHPATIYVEQVLTDAQGHTVGHVRSRRHTLAAADTLTFSQPLTVKRPHLWSPEKPYLYTLTTRILQDGRCIDGGQTRIGIRSFEFRGREGFWLNGRRYRQLVGANRHQDFAYVGNAVPNSQQWRDALRLKRAGFNLIRTAHYPQDPAFMDACDELGLLVIVATPGWQYWNKDPLFAHRVMQNTREIIRRDRNHPSVLMWEPILNETRFPLDFSLEALRVTREEYPYPYRPAAAADMHSAGVSDHYDVVYGWPGDDEKPDRPGQCILTREFGEYVDDWYAHNNLNRASRSWGERPQLVQALSLARTTEEMYRSSGQFIGGCQWHPFDHQRGYHPDPYWGGIYDAFRQPKTAFQMFAAQRRPTAGTALRPELEVQPTVYIAHEMTQFSDSDVVVFSNCDSVRLSIYDGARQWTLPVSHVAQYQRAGSTFSQLNAQYARPVTFRNVWNFWEARQHSYTEKNWQKVNLVAEGIIGGRVVCSTRRMPSRRSTRLRLYADTLGRPLVADGSDFVVVVAEVTDDNGNVRRLAKESIVFTVEGEGRLIGDTSIGANPRAVEWGSAPALIRSTRKAGQIRIRAEVLYPGTHAPAPAELVIESVPYEGRHCFISQRPIAASATAPRPRSAAPSLTDEQKNSLLKEVEQQQADFGIMH